MSKANFVPAKYQLQAFNCPRCGVYARQIWGDMFSTPRSGPLDIKLSNCVHCNQYLIWNSNGIIYPLLSGAEPPTPDMPGEVLVDYMEAMAIAGLSPRGAAALLRLGIQRLCVALGEPGKNINADIQALVDKGLPPTVQKALDIVRVVGNNAVHPGELDLNDDRDTVNALFGLMNIIVEKMISEPQEIASLYDSLPKGALDAINKRNGK